ncbi:MAG TPA: AraC family transcriptional regulator [Candidatus Levilactobacillus faecigallinarum]|uniref:AraC family transcriptional regulator n=1 Tax=Candidatus Levilactobacillus faecigallinarum TaxID=2838638 RepID=A0A9D1QRN5_9LACO|nr:AraC family transcriptional regulator [Candidatus Levilactobacillus faecigallinarum]
MGQPAYISISCLPLPTFIEGGHKTFHAGERHPNRNHLQFFILMLMEKGELYIAEDGVNYTIKAGEMFLLRPRHHHYSWHVITEDTTYYWLHFYVMGRWEQASGLTPMGSVINVPTLHHYTPVETLYLAKHAKMQHPKRLVQMTRQIFKNSEASDGYGFWQAQQIFIDVLQEIQVQSQQESAMVQLSNQLQRYLRDHFNEKITSTTLSQEFHFHPNHLIRTLKATTGLTPTEYLRQYRMEEASKRLLNTSMSETEIAAAVGFQNIYYFSTVFKQYMGVAPTQYRQAQTRQIVAEKEELN